MEQQTQEEQRVRTFVSGSPVGIDARAIERELTNLFAGARTNVDPGKAVVRFSLFNLISVARDEEQSARLAEEIVTLASNYPCRAIVLLNKEDDSADNVTATIAAHCRVPVGGGAPVCGEQITLTATGSKDAIKLLPGTAIPLVVSDLPVILSWPDWPSYAVAEDGWTVDPILFAPLLDSADQLLIDSSRFTKPLSNLARLGALREHDYPSVAVTDLNWLRLTSWRQLTAQLFDSPTLRPYLSNLTQVNIRYVVKDGKVPNQTQALLYLGWLANQLGWQPVDINAPEAGNSTMSLKTSSGRRIEVGIQTCQSDGIWSGDVGEIDLKGLYNNTPATFRLERTAAVDNPTPDEQGRPPVAEHIRTAIEVEGQAKIERVVLLGDRTLSELVGQAMGHLGHDQTYESVLRLAVWMGSSTGTKKIDKGVRGDNR